MAGGSAVLCSAPAGSASHAPVFGLFFLLMLWSRPQRLVLTPTRVSPSAAARSSCLGAVADAEIFGCPRADTVDMLGVTATDPGAAVWTRGSVLRPAQPQHDGHDLCAGGATSAARRAHAVA